MRYMIFIAAVFGATAVLLGAFAAHGLKSVLGTESLAILQTGVQYQFIHALALLMVTIFARQSASRALNYAAVFFTLGVILFSGSLYLLVLTPFKLGVITPIGGILLVGGWVSLASSAWAKD